MKVKVTCTECKTVGEGIANDDNTDLLSFKCEKCGLTIDENSSIAKFHYEYEISSGDDKDNVHNP